MHVILVLESTTEPGKFEIETIHMTGEDIDGRMKAALSVMLTSWAKDWKLVSISHTLVQ